MSTEITSCKCLHYLHLVGSYLHHSGPCRPTVQKHWVGLSLTLNFKNTSQALNMHYLQPLSDVALLSQACALHVFQRCWKTSRDFTDMPQNDTDNIHLAAMATASTVPPHTYDTNNRLNTFMRSS